MEITVLTVGAVYTNCYIINKEGNDACLVIDPGDEAGKIASYIKKRGLHCEGILLTHGHFDHITGVSELVSLAGGKVYACEAEKELLLEPDLNASAMTGRAVSLSPDVLLCDGQRLEAAGLAFTVLHTPGHTKGGCCYYSEEEKVLFAGDTIFLESVGRDDFPTGNGRELISSIRDKILTLPDDVKIYPGHGPETNVAYEAANNPYL